MKLATKTLVVVLVTVLGMAVAIDFTASQLVVRQLLAVEAIETKERAQIVAGALGEQADTFRTLSQDWAVWSEMVDFAGAPKAEFAEQNMTTASFRLKKWRHMAIVRSADHQPAWAGELVSPEVIAKPPASFLDLAGTLAEGPDKEAPKDGFVSLDGTLYLAASQPLRMSDGRPGPTRGAMVYTLRIDETWLQKIRELTSLDLRLVMLADAREAGLENELYVLQAGDAVRALRQSDEVLATYTLLRDLGGEPLALVEIKHPRPHLAAAREMSRALSIGIAVGAVLLAFAAYLIVHRGLLRPIAALGELVTLIKDRTLDRATRLDRAVTAKDELGQLARGVEAMAVALAEREDKLMVAEDLARAVLDNIDEALVLCDPAGNIVSEVSAPALAWFGEPKGKVWEYLLADPAVEWRLRFGMEQLADGFLPAELAIAQLPSQFVRANDTYFVRYRPLAEGEKLNGLLFVIECATERVALAASEAEATEVRSALRHAINDPQEFRAFIRDAESQLRAFDDATQPDIRARALHTLKGTTACFGLQSVAHVAHQVENELADDPHFSPAQLHRLRTAWNTALARLRTEIDIDDDSLVVPEREYEAALALVVNARPATPRISGVRTDPPCA